MLIFVILVATFQECSAQQEFILRHVSNQELMIRAGYFDASTGFYMGGVPNADFVHRFDDNDCQQTTAGNKSYCSYWHITQSGGGSSSDGDCKCTRGSTPNNTYCSSYFCDQTVTAVTTCSYGDGDSYSCISTFAKYKLCRCTKGDPFGRFCSRWQCLGYNDGPIKTANWFCKTLASEEIGTPFNQDYCYTFGSDQYSESVQEAKDCACTQDGGTYCAHWVCEDRIYKNWPWWTPLVASLVGGVLNLWVPFAVKSSDDDCCAVTLVVWSVISFLEIVLVGGVPSLIANAGALALCWLVAYRETIACFTCHCSTHRAYEPSSHRYANQEEMRQQPHVVTGTVLQSV